MTYVLLKGYSMHLPKQSDSSAKIPKTSGTRFEGDVFRRIGNIRSVTLDNKNLNLDRIFGMTRSVQNSFDQIFGSSNDVK